MKLPRTLLVPLALLLLVLSISPRSGAEQGQPAPQKPVAVFLLRHAETAAPTGGGGDPELSEPGKARAQQLARLLGKAGVTHLFASEYARTQATLAPLAGALGLKVETVPAGESARQVAALRALPPGSVAVVAGHSNTVPALVEALGG
jgi:phosphohistidine phosphatase SixA